MLSKQHEDFKTQAHSFSILDFFIPFSSWSKNILILSTQKRYPRELSYGSNNPVIALSENEVAKIFSGDTRSDIGGEAEKMKVANSINVLRTQAGDKLFVKYVEFEKEELEQFKIFFLNR